MLSYIVDIYLCANYFPFRDVANSNDANRLHCDDERRQLLQPLLLTTNPLGPCMHFHFLSAIRALHVSYSRIVHPKMLDCYGGPVAIAAVDLTFAFALVSMMLNGVRFSDVDCDDVPEIQEINLVD